MPRDTSLRAEEVLGIMNLKQIERPVSLEKKEED